MRPLLIALVAFGSTSCAQQCRKVAADRQAFEARQITPAKAPHLSVLIPQKLIDDAIADGLRRIAPKDVPIPGLGQLAQYIDVFRIAPDRVAMQRLEDGRFRVAMDLDVKLGGSSLFKMAAGTDTAAVADAKKGTVELALRPDMIQAITPSVPADAVPKLAAAMLAKVPRAARMLIPERQVRQIAEGAVQALTTSAFEIVRREVLTPMGELARFRFEMPDLPLEGLALVSEGGALRIDARTTLPVTAGLSAQALSTPMGQFAANQSVQGAPSDRIEVRFAAQTVVELVNRAMSRGDLPGKYDLQGNPSAGGNVVAALAWATGERPLKVDVWNPVGVCLKARVAAKPLLSIGADGLQVGVENAEVEMLDGPPLLQQASGWARRMWGNAADQGQGSTKGARLSLGAGGPAGFGLAGVKLQGDTFVFGLSVGGDPKQSAAAAPASGLAGR